jgi:hypothetical protein
MIANSIKDFSLQAARHYLQSAVFIDDNIYNQAAAVPASGEEIQVRHLKQVIEEEAVLPLVAEEAASAQVAAPAPFRTKDLVGRFAAHGIVCALYEPEASFPTDESSIVFKLCDTADLIVLDWDFNEVGVKGAKPRDLIANLVKSGNRVAPHHVRLISVYTTTPQLSSVANSILQHLESLQIQVDLIGTGGLRLQCGSTRILILGKEIGYRAEDELPFSVTAGDLADRLITEFADMNVGILPSCALLGLSAVRKSSLRILNKFRSSLDGQFLLHRALIRDSEEAFEQLPELIADEFRAVLEDSEYSPENLEEFISEIADGINIASSTLTFSSEGAPSEQADAVLRRLIKSRISKPHFDKIKKKPRDYAALFNSLHGGEDKRFAALLSERTSYTTANKNLGFGTFIKRQVPDEFGTLHSEYSVCFVPICDSLRLNGNVTFPFWKLELTGSGPKQCLTTPTSEIVELVLAGKTNTNLWTHQFTASATGTIPFSATSDGRQILASGGLELEWMGQLKQAHAQRLAYDISQNLSRIGLVEAEWLRLAIS